MQGVCGSEEKRLLGLLKGSSRQQLQLLMRSDSVKMPQKFSQQQASEPYMSSSGRIYWVYPS